MSNWWQNMAPRERLLIGIAAVLTVIIVAWQFIYVPPMSARDEARANLDEADRVLSQIQENYEQAGHGLVRVNVDLASGGLKCANCSC